MDDSTCVCPTICVKRRNEWRWNMLTQVLFLNTNPRYFDYFHACIMHFYISSPLRLRGEYYTFNSTTFIWQLLIFTKSLGWNASKVTHDNHFSKCVFFKSFSPSRCCDIKKNFRDGSSATLIKGPQSRSKEVVKVTGIIVIYVWRANKKQFAYDLH